MTTHDDDGAIIEDAVLSRESGCYGDDVSKGVWHMVEALELGSVVFECEDGGVCGARTRRYIRIAKEMRKVLSAVWQFCSYLFVPQWGRKLDAGSKAE